MVALSSAPAEVGQAAAQGGRATLSEAAEAWYSMPPADPCASPVGCLPADPPVATAYPADTLRVAATAGHETARSFVVPELSGLPRGAVAATGTLVIPVDMDAASGTVS